MLAAMQVSAAGPASTGDESVLSVEACLARFTDKETLSAANMITCETCSGRDADTVPSPPSSSSKTSQSATLKR